MIFVIKVDVICVFINMMGMDKLKIPFNIMSVMS